MMIRKNVLAIYLLLPGFLYSQVFDDFSDGDFTFNPGWTGDVDQFTICWSSAVPSQQKPCLQLYSEGTDTSFLCLSTGPDQVWEWRFWVKLGFNTSSYNYAKFYLASDSPDLERPLNGYFMQIGGKNDSIELFRQDGDVIERIFQVTSFFTGNSVNIFRFKITRDSTGYWELFGDPAGGFNFQPGGSGRDTLWQPGGWSGFYCVYSSSNSTDFYFDDYYAGPLITDTILPNYNRAQPYDIIINEILFNPLDNGADYVEIYNRSLNTIDINNLSFALVKDQPPDPPDTIIKLISFSSLPLPSSEYLVLTDNSEAIKAQYYCPDADAFLDMASFPSLDHQEGITLIIDTSGTIIDVAPYSEDMQYPLLNSFKGVSLEKINPSFRGVDRANWHSASEIVGFGTPGYKNSQFVEETDWESALEVSPEIFSPDGDGTDDLLNIGYAMPSPGFTGSVIIFNYSGQWIKTLINNELLGSSGTFTWDGINDHRERCLPGIYIIYFEAFDLNGKIIHLRKVCVLAFR